VLTESKMETKNHKAVLILKILQTAQIHK